MQQDLRTPSPADVGPQDPDEVLFQERLGPSAAVWAVAALLAALTILVFAPIDLWMGLAAAAAAFAVEAIVLVASTPRIVVTGRSLQVGRAQIERRHLGAVRGYCGEDARMQRGPQLHGLAYVCVRGWISPVARIQITDERDTTPYWLTSTRHPEELTEALGGRMAAEDE
ncbi:DUF3093 domain-containing protein [Micrococcus sp.]|uniref:DUF3093 domain-containing protein n=1 Tax=Micrococcus sp. TaxID=1271 RepID=UPI002A91C04D|nr:DUF3093 domain-containing protein [Micrococcus sp.]MDY6055514.1 DUF3093 domain-containing protein [Micrococcus sp.]